jgi:hypothetical protein
MMMERREVVGAMVVEGQEGDLQRVTEMAKRQLALEKELEAAEEHVKAIKLELRMVQNLGLPELMAELELQDFTLTDGHKIAIHQKVRAHIRKEDKEAAYTWLKENGYEEVVKAKVTAEFKRGEVEQKELAVKALHDAGVQCQQKEDVHPMTLNKLASECLEDGFELPAMFGVFVEEVAKIST